MTLTSLSQRLRRRICPHFSTGEQLPASGISVNLMQGLKGREFPPWLPRKLQCEAGVLPAPPTCEKRAASGRSPAGPGSRRSTKSAARRGTDDGPELFSRCGTMGFVNFSGVTGRPCRRGA